MAKREHEVPYERLIVPESSMDDLDPASIAETISRAARAGRLDAPTDQTGFLHAVAAIGLDTEDNTFKPTVAGLLAFGHTPDYHVRGAGIDIGILREDRVVSTLARVAAIRGPITTVVDRAVEALVQECTAGRLDGARIVPELTVPLIVLRELTTNAVIHRDLSIEGSQVRIRIMPSTIEWFSPGGLPSGVTIETLLTAQHCRNPALAHILYVNGYIERFGMGLSTVLQALDEAELPPPEFFDHGHSFRVRIRRVAAGQRVIPRVLTGTSRKERLEAILELFQNQHSWQVRDLVEYLNVSRSTLLRDLDTLVEAGQLTASGATHQRVYHLAT